jgi:hypothetical protein
VQDHTDLIPETISATYYDEVCAQQAVLAAEKRVATQVATKRKNADFKTDQPAEYRKKRDAIIAKRAEPGGYNDQVKRKNAKPGGYYDQRKRKNADIKTDQPAEYREKRDANNEQQRKARGRATQTQQEIMTRRRWARIPKPAGMHIVQVQQISAPPPQVAPQQLVVGVHYAKGQLLYCQASADWNAAGWAWCQTNELLWGRDNEQLRMVMAGGQPPLGAPPPLSGGGGGGGRRRRGGWRGGALAAGSWRSPCHGSSRSHIGGLRLLASAVTRGCLVAGEGQLNKEPVPPTSSFGARGCADAYPCTQYSCGAGSQQHRQCFRTKCHCVTSARGSSLVRCSSRSATASRLRLLRLMRLVHRRSQRLVVAAEGR